jgi:hypothetical protein
MIPLSRMGTRRRLRHQGRFRRSGRPKTRKLLILEGKRPKDPSVLVVQLVHSILLY